MNKALEFTKMQDGFEEFGKFTFCKASRPPTALSQRAPEPAPQAKPEPQAKLAPQAKPEPLAKPDFVDYDTPGYILARKECQRIQRYMQEKEKISAFMTSDIQDEDLDVDIDRIPPRPAMSWAESCKQAHRDARQVTRPYKNTFSCVNLTNLSYRRACATSRSWKTKESSLTGG